MPRGCGRGGRRRGGGSGGGFGRGRYWTQPVPDEGEGIQRPPGLRGKEIGMFYKNLSKSKPPAARQSRLEASLAIPPVVFKQVGNLIKNIKGIACRNNIKVNYVSRQKKFELLSRIKMEQESVIELKDTNDDDDVLINEVTPEVLVIESDEEDLKAEPFSANIKVEAVTNNFTAQEVCPAQPSTSKSSAAEKAMLMNLANKPSVSDLPSIFNSGITKQEKDVVISEQDTSSLQPFKSAAETFLSNKKLELIRKQNEFNKQDAAGPAAEYLAKKKQDLMRRQQAHKSSWNRSLAPIADYNSLRAEVASRVNQQANPHFKGSEDFISLSNPSQPEQVREQPVSQLKETEFIPFSVQPGMSGVHNMPDFIPVKQESHTLVKRELSSSHGPERIMSLREKHAFKYSYHDIITGTFNEKLDEELAKGITINRHTEEIQYLSEKYYTEYQDMIQERKYKEMLKFREKLPAYYKARELLKVINSNSVVVISGETGCGKSTQVPQLILDEAILNKKGANTKIMVTQPRRIAASSLAERVAAERAEPMGSSVGYAVRLERQDSRPRGSIMYVTTGILLTELEVNQGLTNFSHIILDEVHERDTHVDLSMMVLKEILKKRKDLKVILMSATLNAEALSGYFDNCPVLHIEGLAYPVQDIYLEDIYKLINFTFEDLPPSKQANTGHRHGGNYSQSRLMERDIQHRAKVVPWIESIKKEIDRTLYKILLDPRSELMNLDVILKLLIYLIKSPPGAILVFLPGIGEISKLLRSMEESNAFPNSNFEIYPLHSKLPSLEQRKIFERPPDHIRKIIIATNIAETSITIDDVVYVIDCGKVKLSGLNVEDNIETLQTEWASKANLHQRRGRAGRCQAGICYHLVTSHRASQLDERLLPELQRNNLLEAVLMTKQLRLGKAEEAFQRVLDPPDMKTVKWAVKRLQQIGCLDEEETLTPLGWHLARLPVHPAAGKLMLLGALFGCLDRAASVAAVWGFKDPFMMVIGKESETDETKAAFALDEPSDHVALSEAIIAWERTFRRDRRSFCYDNFLSNNTLALLTEMKQQFGNNLKQMGFLPTGDIRAQWENRNLNNLSLFKAIVAAALYPNVAKVKWNGLRSRNLQKPPTVSAYTTEDGRVSLHPSSVCAPRYNSYRTPRYSYQPAPLKRWQQREKPGAGWLVYWLKQKSTALFLIEVTLVYTLPLMFFGELEVTYDETCPTDCFLWISTHRVRCDLATADLLFELRSLLDHVLASKVGVGSTHAISHSEFDNQVLNAVIELITAEDEQVESMEECVSDSDNEYDSKNNQRNWRMRN